MDPSLVVKQQIRREILKRKALDNLKKHTCLTCNKKGKHWTCARTIRKYKKEGWAPNNFAY